MNIVILDGYLVNPGDLSWGKISELGNLKVYDITPKELVAERVKNADIILLNNSIVAKEAIEKANNLKYISMLATGYDNVDVEECKKRRIKISNIPSYGTDTVAQFTFALLLEVCNNVKIHSDAVFSGDYTYSDKYGLPLKKQYELSGKTIGIIGYGNIGKKVGEIAKAFGMKVLAYRGENKGKIYDEEVSLEYLLENSDVISLHAKLTEENAEIINTKTISKMKNGVIIINVARGGLIVEEDLKEALNSGKILGAGIDVITTEPIQKDNILLKANNLIITPHIAWTTREARQRIIDIAADNIRGYINGKYINTIN
ncbi:D-2-hydroxyacid dehydrogenase [Miniphocaeibacter massiliensis]|uniref:D-2-hydroxyacid dehydrogenase n=1 Tax=Miniphocaeibacter massiliensis TaxID=2041841 RepID=UPI0013EB1D4F|nr:D-2-hydroxyacid dehydrogenase [Miniphocaeibacter massiliensis]